jgi:three-Cys-motif partner protein
MAGRTWGIWTRGKLDVLRRYLDAFTTTTKNKATETIYIDAFAGQPENKDRLTDEPIDGSAKIALSIDDPPFTILRFFETERNAAALERGLLSDFPDRDFQVLGGDSNELVPLELRRLRHLNWAPTFAFVDPNGMEAEWRTLEAIAAFKEGRKWKAEIFYLFSPPMFQRLLRVDGNEVRPQDSAAITAVFGTDDWDHIYQARLNGEIESSRAGDEYLNLMRWRMETVLDYQWTHPLEVRNERGRVIYHMIFATDHPVGNEIMSDVYAQAAAEFPAMREEARRLRKQKELKDQGVMSLFDDDDWRAPAQPGERFYEHESPTRPWFTAEEE